ncbi:2-polyprenyl-3-methyl-6-methoxy-1,4-benzoquinone monooxygenase [Pollutimonas harenae]|uniref:3-demethoxyubiquinol 3-hydroxylase n=1 Tax=Pollutimonas harenae TaxID=657015 RepID=A0A853H8X5_9BURK|nr:2-polyprenyl-3-methyl-6-methoxy-1,4-benzoquinone monooxygenase [Pollutimonas harenae]NYT86903.1 2-polyprenyl-3-methyl-6-methoxy-1,4-benzoquinone monooxygenase [Pollutimonas harenae]TEA69383.1 2-polyprenyl-3-methyl-6-methoxy-1,4-benzoquinone monooxygenase [Pollutimonas harenae]
MSKLNSTLEAPQFARRMGFLDRALAEAGRAVRVLDGSVQAGRTNPAGPRKSLTDEAEVLTPAEQKHAAGLMRVNHVGEICAQALYRGQALFCRDAPIKAVLHQAAAEEVDHLVWCRDRLNELNSRPSLLNPLWYVGSFSLGVLASRAGVPKNLGFMAETERQVEQHLDRHLADLPPADGRSRSIVTQMRDDEISHRTTAETHGAQKLPRPLRGAMRLMSKVMTTTAYRI